MKLPNAISFCSDKPECRQHHLNVVIPEDKQCIVAVKVLNSSKSVTTSLMAVVSVLTLPTVCSFLSNADSMHSMAGSTCFTSTIDRVFCIPVTKSKPAEPCQSFHCHFVSSNSTVIVFTSKYFFYSVSCIHTTIY